MDDDGPPPPPPPHGEKPNTTQGEYRKTSDLPTGNYDIFVIPPHSSGSGFLYLPSLQCQRNSFIAGSVSTLFVVLVWSLISPILKRWFSAAATGSGGIGIAIIGLGMGIAGWAFGAYQTFGGAGAPGQGGSGSGGSGAGAGSQSQSAGAGANSNFPNSSGQNGSQKQRNGGPQGNQYSGNQRGAGGPPPNDSSGPPPSAQDKEKEWERAREETKRKEDLRRKMEEFKRKREAEAKEKQRQRERETMERELRERREQLEKEIAAAKAAAAREARERAEREAAEVRAREARLRAERDAAEARARAEREAGEAKARAEREAAEAKARAERAAAEEKERQERSAAEAKAKAEKEAAEKEAAAKAAAKKEADAKFAALKEAAAKKYAEKKAKDAQEAAEKEAAAKREAAAKETASRASRSPSPKKAGYSTTSKEDEPSFRPYDRPRRPYGGTSGSSAYSESSYAPSQSTARTSPPPSNRGTYSTKDPDKIVIQGVFAYNNVYPRDPVAQLVSGQGIVTDGLVLRITTEGLFIDDDVRSVPQREWDVKAWTMKLAEIWCPQHGDRKNHSKSSNPFRSAPTGLTPEESDAYLANILKVCKNTCRLSTPNRNADSEFAGLHVFRATMRDQEGKKYLFVLQETEGWKVAIGLQRLRRGTQARGFGVVNMPVNECKLLLGSLGYI